MILKKDAVKTEGLRPIFSNKLVDRDFDIMGYVSSKNIAHISFDFWNTLGFSNPNFKKNRSLLMSKLIGQSQINVKEIESAFKEVGDSYNSQLEQTGEIKTPDKLYKQVFEKLYSEQILEYNEITSQINSLFHIYPPLIPYDFLIDLFVKLESLGVTLSITSNTAFITGEEIKRFLDLSGILNYFAFTTFSDEIGVAKPHEEIFHKVFLQVKIINNTRTISKKNCLHIGDNYNTDYLGSLNFGFQSILI
jgi:putative hydrolase of the HAD superfamily